IIGEIAAQLARLKNPNVKYLREIGGTRVVWNALLNGDIDIYPDYTGTIKEEILARKTISSNEEMIIVLNKLKIKMSKPLGFNNTYALGMKKSLAQKLHIEKISDLKKYPGLKFGFSSEFMDRKDGWPGLNRKYNLPQKNVVGMDHDLAYRGLDNGSIDLTDLYSTDAEIEYYNLKILKDDLNYF